MNVSSSKVNVAGHASPFYQSDKRHVCVCPSCSYSVRHQSMLSLLFFWGFILPICWLINLGLFIYAQYCLKHKVQFSSVAEDEFPTAYELNVYRSKMVVANTGLAVLNNDIKHQNTDRNSAESISLPELEPASTHCDSSISDLNSPSTFRTSLANHCPNIIRICDSSDLIDPVSNDMSASSIDLYHSSRLDFLTNMSTDVIAFHHSMRKKYHTWAGRTLLSLAGFLVILLIGIVGVGRNSSSSNFLAPEWRSSSK